MSKRYVYVSIGNSDDKLTQLEWADFCYGVRMAFADAAWTDDRLHLHGVWYSRSDDQYQNACWCVEVAEEAVPEVQTRLSSLATQYRQRAIAWAEATYGEITPIVTRENENSRE